MFFYHFLLPQVEIFSRVVKDAWHPIPLRSFSTQHSVKKKKNQGFPLILYINCIFFLLGYWSNKILLCWYGWQNIQMYLVKLLLKIIKFLKWKSSIFSLFIHFVTKFEWQFLFES